MLRIAQVRPAALVEHRNVSHKAPLQLARLSRLCHHPHLVGHTQLIIEKNGPGQVVDEMIRRAKLPVSYLPVTTTGGSQVIVRGSDRFAPKEKLIGTLEYLFQQNLLKISSQIPQPDLLREELRQFERRSQRGGASKLGAGYGDGASAGRGADFGGLHESGHSGNHESHSIRQHDSAHQ